MFEFTNMVEIYRRTIIETDLTENYFNSIIHFEKSLFSSLWQFIIAYNILN